MTLAPWEDTAVSLMGSLCVPVFAIQQEVHVGTRHTYTTGLNLIPVKYKIMRIPQCFLSPVFSTSQWRLPFQKENHSGSLATRIVSVTSWFPPFSSFTTLRRRNLVLATCQQSYLAAYIARPCIKNKTLKRESIPSWRGRFSMLWMFTVLFSLSWAFPLLSFKDSGFHILLLWALSLSEYREFGLGSRDLQEALGRQGVCFPPEWASPSGALFLTLLSRSESVQFPISITFASYCRSGQQIRGLCLSVGFNINFQIFGFIDKTWLDM